MQLLSTVTNDLMPPNPAPPDALPPRLAWFAPWRWFARWRPWKRWTLVAGAALVGYVLSPVPLNVSLQRLGLWTPAVQQVCVIAYYPLIVVAMQSKPVGQSYQWQRELLVGETPP